MDALDFDLGTVCRVITPTRESIGNNCVRNVGRRADTMWLVGRHVRRGRSPQSLRGQDARAQWSIALHQYIRSSVYGPLSEGWLGGWSDIVIFASSRDEAVVKVSAGLRKISYSDRLSVLWHDHVDALASTVCGFRVERTKLRTRLGWKPSWTRHVLFH